MSDPEPQPLYLKIKSTAARLRAALGKQETVNKTPPSSDNETLSDTNAHEAWLVHNVNQLHDIKVMDVMVPRSDIVAVDYQTTLEELLKIITANPYSRLPVYRDNLDEVIGIIHIKDILDSIVAKKEFDLSALIRQTRIVVPSMNILDLLLDMRLTRIHMAVVIDEYGGVDGVVTIEDLLEQIVGNIEDERDLEAPRMTPLMEGAWLADGRLPLENLQDVFGDILSEEDVETSDTLGGLIVALAHRVPHRGEVISHPGGMDFDILEADKRRVLRVRIRKVTDEAL